LITASNTVTHRIFNMDVLYSCSLVCGFTFLGVRHLTTEQAKTYL